MGRGTWLVAIALVVPALSACASGSPAGRYAAFSKHMVPINNQLFTELSDGSPASQFNWPKIAADEVRWLNDQTPDPCYEQLFTDWKAAMKELAAGGDPGTGEATGHFVLTSGDTFKAAAAACQ